jgi:hypothetical protein
MNKQDVLALLEPEKFMAWLEAKPEIEVVGHCQVPTECPVYQYLTEMGVPGASVTGTHVEFDVTVLGDWPVYELVPAPAWLHQFVRGVDRSGGAFQDMTARACRVILRDVLAAQPVAA